MSTDNRTVATDALATLGTIITEKEKRDAIHLAVIPAVAGQLLAVGADVFIGDDGLAYHAYRKTQDKEFVGIVDPFLSEIVDEGERFWLIIYPRKITSLRHVWEHPAFPNESEAEKPAREEADQEAISNAYMEKFAAQAGYTSKQLISVLREAYEKGWDTVSAKLDYAPDSTFLDEQFYYHLRNITGINFNPAIRPTWISCSC